MPKTIALVIHGARADAAGLRDAVATVRAAGHAVRVRATWERGDAERFAREEAALGADAVVAAGGDGTVNEVVNGLLGTDVPLGIVPLGTANDFARQAAIPADPRAALDLVLSTAPTRIDLGDLDGRAFVNVSTAGIGAELTAEMDRARKERLGPIAYAITGVRWLVGDGPVRRARFTGPDFAVELEYLVFAVGNARATGAGVVITPRASVRDGLLDLCVVGPVGRAAFAPLLLDVKRGEHLAREGVDYVQTPWVRVESAEPIPVNLDGEPGERRVLGYRVRPGALLAHLARVPGEDAAG